MEKIIYDIEGLDCAHCAQHLAEYLSKCDGIEVANINFIAKTLTVTYKNKPLTQEELLLLALKGTDDHIDIKEHKEKKSLKVKIFDKEILINLIRITISVILLLVGIFAFDGSEPYNTLWGIRLGVFIVGYLVISYDYLWKFLKAFRHPSKMFNETVLMVVASLGAFVIESINNEPQMEALLVMILAQVGEIFEHISVNKSKNSIISTIDTRPKMAELLVDGKTSQVLAQDLKIGDEIIIKTGEVIPCDGKVTKGTALLDTSSVTGEFKPVDLKENDVVLSGTTLIDGTIHMEVVKEFNNSTTSKILDLVMESSETKSKAEKFINKFANWYTPIVFALALIIGGLVPLIIGLVNNNLSSWPLWFDWINKGLTFLVISCPCAIVISVPLTYFVGTTLAFKKGIIVKGSNYLDRLNELSVLVTDKTGTLTTGQFSVKDKLVNKGFEDVFDTYVCALESTSNHPIAKAVVHQINAGFAHELVKNTHELPGFGIVGDYDNHHLLLGNINLMNKENIKIENPIDEATYLIVDSKFAGYILLDDTIKENSKKTIAFLSKKGVETLMLTGGDFKSANRVSKELGITSFKSELLPQDKIDNLKKTLENKKKKSCVAYLGDGINDAPSIIMADVGIAMGGMGADAAVENADIVLTNDDPVKVVEMVKIARATRNRAIFNIIFALLLKLTVMILAVLGYANMIVGVLCDTGLSLFLVIVSILLIRKKIKVE